MTRNTTVKEFELFKSECLKWIDYFGLKDWKIDFLHEELKSESYAECRVEGISSRNVVLCFNTKCSEYDRKCLNIRKTAFHEVWELILWPLQYIGTCRYVQPEEFTTAVHSVIRTMENTIYKE
jgi:hypothetical protein